MKTGKSIMGKMLFAAVALGCVLFGPANPAAGAEGTPAAPGAGGGMGKTIAARVNGVEITVESLATMMRSLASGEGHEAGPPKSPGEIRKEALEQLVIQELAYQKATREGFSAEGKEIDDALAAMKKKLGGEEKFKEYLAKERIAEADLRKRIERNLTLRKIFKAQVADGFSVSEEAVREAYEKNKDSYARREKIVVTDVVFFLPPDAPSSVKKAEEVRARIATGKEMNPGALVSDGTFAVTEVEIDEGRDKELYAAVKKMKVGELSGVISASGNLHLVLLRDYTPSMQYTFDQVKQLVEKNLRSRAIRERLEIWEAGLKKGAKVEILDAGTGAGGGK